MKNEGVKGAEGASMAQSGKPSRGQPPEDSGKELSRQGEWARTSGEGDCVAEALHRADETAEEWATGKRATEEPTAARAKPRGWEDRGQSMPAVWILHTHIPCAALFINRSPVNSC